MQKAITALLTILLSINLYSQEKINIYNPDANASLDIDKALVLASDGEKHILVMIGGNWCPWCIRLHSFLNEDHEIDSLIRADYVKILVNYSKENKNDEVLQELGFPQRFGFPVLVILNDKGQRLHTQNSWFLEQDKSYNRKKILAFLKGWDREAIDPSSY